MPYAATTAITEFWAKCKAAFAPKSHTHDEYQPTLVSGTNIKTVNSESLLGSGNISISGGGATTTWYGTCSTAAATAAKAVTCSGFELVKGAIIGVLFTTANTAATPTLNVNSTGAKTIYVGNATLNATTNTLKWSANSMLYFMYDGTYWRYMADSAGAAVVPRGANTWYAICSTAAATAAKVGTVANFVLTRGALVAVTFTYANTVSAVITLNVNSTGAKTIYVGNAATSASNPLLWDAGETLLFVYSGSYYYLVARSSGGSYELPTASASTLGGVKVGSGLSIDSSGVLSASSTGGVSYTTQAVSIPASAWSGTTATVSAAAVTASNDVIIAPAPASIAAWAAAGVYCSAQGAGTLTFACSTAPTAALTANVMAFEGGVELVIVLQINGTVDPSTFKLVGPAVDPEYRTAVPGKTFDAHFECDASYIGDQGDVTVGYGLVGSYVTLNSPNSHSNGWFVYLYEDRTEWFSPAMYGGETVSLTIYG